jgi:glycosyltransferase involved in cell wall biosynthesis
MVGEVGSRKIRVLRIIARMNIGGPAIQVTTLMNYIPKDEVNQLLVTGACEEGEADYLDFNQIGLERKIIPGLGRRVSLLNDFKALLEIRKTMKSFEPDILHTHTFKAGILGRVAALSFKERPFLVHTFHGHLLHGYLGVLKLGILKAIERFLARRTDVLVSVGEKVKHELLAAGIGNPTKFVVVPPGFPIAESNLNKNRSLQLGSEPLKCAWIGRIVEVKAPERVLEIARRFSNRKSDVQFLIAGDGPLRIEIQDQSESESLPIKFLGWVGDVPALLKEVDLLVLTSLNEGTPLSIIEAQRIGKPVISTDVGSVREIISDGKSGYVLDFDSDKFAEFIHSFATDRDKLEEFSKEAIKFSGEKFAPERLAKDHLRIYKKLTSS